MTFLAEAAMLSHGWRRFLLLLVAGAVAGLSVPPLFILPALFLALPIWVWCLDGAEQRSGWLGRVFGPAFRIGFAFGLGYFTVAFHWLGAAFLVEGGPMIAVMPFGILALAALIAVFWGLGSALAHLFWSGGPWRIVTLATAITSAEWARGHFFTGFPFDLIGYALTANGEMMQLSAVVGVYGLTFLVLLIAATPALIWPGEGRALTRRLLPFFVSLVVIAAQLGWGSFRLAGAVTTPIPDLRMRLVQPAIYDHADWAAVDPAAIVTHLVELSQTKTGPTNPGLPGINLLVWPESAFPFFISQYPDALARVARILAPTTTLLVGAPREQIGAGESPPDSPLPAFNAILAVDRQGEVIASYDKSHLVPFGEYLPFAAVFAKLGLRQFVPGVDGWAAGAGRRLMELPGVPPMLALICYEAIFSGDLGPGLEQAQFILNTTNDAWFDGSIGPGQHEHHVRVRAVEEGMSLVRAANTGITELVDPFGRIAAHLPQGPQGVLDVAPLQRLPQTPFAQWRYWPLLLALLLGAAISVLASRAERRRR